MQQGVGSDVSNVRARPVAKQRHMRRRTTGSEQPGGGPNSVLRSWAAETRECRRGTRIGLRLGWCAHHAFLGFLGERTGSRPRPIHNRIGVQAAGSGERSRIGVGLGDSPHRSLARRSAGPNGSVRLAWYPFATYNSHMEGIMDNGILEWGWSGEGGEIDMINEGATGRLRVVVRRGGRERR